MSAGVPPRAAASGAPRGAASAALDCVVLFDLNQPVDAGYDFREELRQEGFETERDVKRALEKLGHTAQPMSLFDESDLEIFLARVKKKRPDLVFNLAEAFRTDRRHEASIVSLLEMLALRYTGSDARALAICKDKALAKKILSFHRVKTPGFLVSAKARPLKRLKPLRFPVFVKPVDTEGSEGIAQAALAADEAAAIERVRFVHESLGTDALVEEFIDGRELYSGVIGNDRLQSLPPIELLVENRSVGDESLSDGAPRFFTYKAKWDAAYRKKWNIRAGVPKDLDAETEQRIAETARKAYHSLGVTGCARVDVRVKADGEIWVIEVNPNPGLAQSDEFAKAAARADIGYESLIERIVQLGLGR